MKYIRTKDGRILESEINDNRKSLGYEPIPFIKQAGTIEELCDEFVAVGIPFKTFIVDLKELKRTALDIHSFSRACYMQYKNCAIYGAIWTDKGLIYVAKMNDKGELELL